MQSFVLERPLYQQTLWFIRRYPEFKARYDDAIRIGGAMAGQPHGTMPQSGVENAAIRRVAISVQISAIERALGRLPEAYRQGVMENIISRKRYPDWAALNTWKTWKQRMVYWTAQEIGWL